MQRYEFCFIRVVNDVVQSVTYAPPDKRRKHDGSLQSVLDTLSHNGWESVNVATREHLIIMMFQRPIESFTLQPGEWQSPKTITASNKDWPAEPTIITTDPTLEIVSTLGDAHRQCWLDIREGALKQIWAIEKLLDIDPTVTGRELKRRMRQANLLATKDEEDNTDNE
jgi:hypothetical protein